jgi:hypoxanthine phosphoribosyltransferase
MDSLPSDLKVLISAQEIGERVETLARRLAPRLDDETVAVCLLIGGLWFAADLTRALARAGAHVRFDALWLSSYGDARRSAAAPGRAQGPDHRRCVR